MKWPAPALLLSCAGCSDLPEVLPTVSFEGLEIRDITFEQADMDFVFLVENPHPVSITLASFDYALALEDVPFVEGDNPDGFTLEALGGSDLVIPLSLWYSDVWNTIQATRGEDVVDFLLSGGMGFETPAGHIRVPYDEEGVFPALRTPVFSLEGIRTPVVDVLVGIAEVEVDVGVDNEHASTLLFQNFDYGLSLGGTPIASGDVPSFDVDGASTGTVTFPVIVDLLSLGAAAAEGIIYGGEVDVGLEATTDVDTPFGIVPLTIDASGQVSISG